MRLLTKDKEQKIALSLHADSTGQEFITQGRGSNVFKGVTIHLEKEWDVLYLEGTRSSRQVATYQDALDTLLQKSLSTAPHLIVFGGVTRFRNYAKANQRKDLEATIRRLVTVPYGDAEWGRISPEVAIAAHEFLALLPADTPLPKVGPDHEGGLLLAWENTSPELIVTLEAHRLHFVVNPGTARAEYFDDIVFTRDCLPPELLPHLPKARS